MNTSKDAEHPIASLSYKIWISFACTFHSARFSYRQLTVTASLKCTLLLQNNLTSCFTCW